MAIKKDALVDKAKNVIAKYKQTKLSEPTADISRIPNAEVGVGAIAQPDNQSTEQKKIESKFGDMSPELDPKNMAKHDEDVENLVMLAYTMADLAPAAASKLMPLFERQAIKVGEQKISPDVIEFMKSKGFTNKQVPEASPSKKWDAWVEQTPSFQRGRGTKNAEAKGAELDEFENIMRQASNEENKLAIDEENKFIEGLRKTYGNDWYKKAFSNNAPYNQ